MCIVIKAVTGCAQPNFVIHLVLLNDLPAKPMLLRKRKKTAPIDVALLTNDTGANVRMHAL